MIAAVTVTGYGVKTRDSDSDSHGPSPRRPPRADHSSTSRQAEAGRSAGLVGTRAVQPPRPSGGLLMTVVVPVRDAQAMAHSSLATIATWLVTPSRPPAPA